MKKPVSATPKIIKKSVTLPQSVQKSSRHKGTCTCTMYIWLFIDRVECY